MRGVHGTSFSMVPSWHARAVGRLRPEWLAWLRRSRVAGLAAHKHLAVVLVGKGIDRDCRGEQGPRSEKCGDDSKACASHRSYPTELGMRFTASGTARRSAPPALNT